MTLFEQALADLKTATTADHLGREVEINGQPVVCVKRQLTAEELSQYAGLGIASEGCRITVDIGKLTALPVAGGEVQVDGHRYGVQQVVKNGAIIRMVLLRYTA